MNASDVLQYIHDSITTLCGTSDIPGVYKKLRDLLKHQVPSWISLSVHTVKNPAPGTIYFKLDYQVLNGAEQNPNDQVIQCSSGLLYQVANTHSAEFVDNLMTNSLFNAQSDALLKEIGNSVAIIPSIKSSTDNIARIFVFAYSASHDADGILKKILLIVTMMLTQIFSNIVTIQALERDAVTDPLTNIYNRRTLVQIADREISRSNRLQRSISFIILDIDNFKDINDSHGHLMGDKVLVHCASVLSDTIRVVDYAFRFAGDEFVVLMPNTNRDDLNKVLERIHYNIEYNNPPLPYVASIGKYSGIPKTLIEMFNIADRNLYKQKSSKKPKKPRHLLHVFS